MSQFALWLLFTCLFTWCIAPRVFLRADSKIIRQQIVRSPRHVSRQASHLVSRVPKQSHHSGRKQKTDLGVLASVCDSLARLIRAGTNSHDAVTAIVASDFLSDTWWVELSSLLNAGHLIEESLQAARDECTNSDHHLLITLLLGSIVHGNFVATALDHASSVLRDMESSRTEAKVAAAQARFSSRLLSLLPIIILGGSLLLSQSFRNGLLTAPILIPIVAGLILNRIGWAWSLRLIQRTTNDSVEEIELLTNHLCVSLRAGYSMWHSCERWHGVSALGNEVSVALHAGQPLEDALLLIREKYPHTGSTLVDVILQADRDGLPVVNTVHRLATDSHMERRRSTDIRVRQLPTRLSIPLVFCVLPSFLLLTIAPIVISRLAHLTVSLPPLQQ